MLRDTLYVANDDNNTISVFAGGFDDPVGLAFHSSGTLYVANCDNNTISQVDAAGDVSGFESSVGKPTFLAVQVPEPATAGALAVAAIAGSATRRGWLGQRPSSERAWNREHASRAPMVLPAR